MPQHLRELPGDGDRGRQPTLSVDISARLGGFHLQPRFAVGRELIVLFGLSGSGKSLTLQAIAGLLRPSAGRIEIDGVPVFDSAAGLNLPPQARGAGYVPQSYALFPHLSVYDNIGFALNRRSASERRQRVAELVALLGLHGLEERRPAALSGGQAQRVALARALAASPRLLLLDEPFSALDSTIRVALRRELTRLRRELALTIVFVTHDLSEAYNLADTIAVFDAGRVLQSGPLVEVFHRPSSARVARLTETRNIWRGYVREASAGATLVDTGRFTLAGNGAALAVGDAADLCIRPERIALRRASTRAARPTGAIELTARIVDEIAHGASHTLFFQLSNAPAPDAGHDFEVDLPAMPYEVLGVARQKEWTLAFPSAAVHVMAVESEQGAPPPRREERCS